MLFNIVCLVLGAILLWVTYEVSCAVRIINYYGIDLFTVMNSTNGPKKFMTLLEQKMIEKTHLLSVRGVRLLGHANQEDPHVQKLQAALAMMAEKSGTHTIGRIKVSTLIIARPTRRLFARKLFDQESETLKWHTYLRELQELYRHTLLARKFLLMRVS